MKPDCGRCWIVGGEQLLAFSYQISVASNSPLALQGVALRDFFQEYLLFRFSI